MMKRGMLCVLTAMLLSALTVLPPVSAADAAVTGDLNADGTADQNGTDL